MSCRYVSAENADVFPGVTARSVAVQEYEKFIHRTCYPHIVHPQSRLRVYWEIAMLIFALCQSMLFFFVWGFVRHDNLVYQTFLMFIVVVHFFDVLYMFFTGYIEDGSEIVVLDPKRIAWRYLRRSFILDTLACIPAELITYFLRPECVSAEPSLITESCQMAMCSTLFTVNFRVFTTVKYLSNTYKVMFWNPFLLNLVSIIIYFLFTISLHIVLTFLVNYILKVRLLYFSNYSDTFETVADFLLEIVFIFVYQGGYSGWLYALRLPATVMTTFFSVYLMAYLIKFTKFTMRTKERFYILETRVRIFARKRRLPPSLRKKTFLYFKVLIQSKGFKQDEMFNYFPEAFKSDMLTHYSLPVIKSFRYFEDLPIHVMRRLTECLKYQLYLPNEIVMMADEASPNLYFVQKGTVALYAADNTELYHFEDGSCFNGTYFIEGKFPKGQYAISVEVTEIYRLDYEDFKQIMGSYPALLQKMKEKFSVEM